MSILDKPIHILGVPMDLGASRRGTDMGPSALRIAGMRDQLRAMGYQVGVEEDIAVPAMETRSEASVNAHFKEEILAVCTRLSECVDQTLDNGAVPLVIGGDHSIAMGTIAGVTRHYARREQTIGLLWFDAHGDMNTPETSPSGNIHGMPLAHVLGHGLPELVNLAGFSPMVKPENVALVGIRDIDDGERAVIRRSGIHAYTMREIDEKGMATVAQEVIDVLTNGTAGFHVSFDVDGCDPSVIPGSGTLVPGGVNFRETHLLLENCADSRQMVSMEVVELNPFLDNGNASAERALGMIQSAFGKRIL
ncbi:MAG: arginase [Xanthomonadales bacterium]|nr:arginase [Xanthomonadales bacterium]